MPETKVYINPSGIANKADVKRLFSQLKEGEYLVTVQSIKKRTLSQNDYYWGCVVPLIRRGLRDAGYNEVKTNADAHEVLKDKFLSKQSEAPASTAKLKTAEFNIYLEEIWQWASEYLGLVIPSPNEKIIIHE